MVGLFLLAGCTQKPNSASVPWRNYSRSVQLRVADAVQRTDCAALKAEFESSENNDANQRRRVGEGNGKLMGYLDAQMSKIGCYSKSPPPKIDPTVPPVRQGTAAGVGYRVIDTVNVEDGTLWLDILFPSLRPGAGTAEAACSAAAGIERAAVAFCYSTAEARKANLSAAYNTSHPGTLDAGYLGTWSVKAGFEAPLPTAQDDQDATPSEQQRVREKELRSKPAQRIEGQVVGITTPWPEGYLSIRSEPSTTSKELSTAVNGERMDVLASTEGWFKVQQKRSQVIGWVSAKYFDRCPCAEQLPPATDTTLEGFPDVGTAIGIFPLPNGNDADFTYELRNREVGEGAHGGDLLTVSYGIRSLRNRARFRDEWQINCGNQTARYVLTDRLTADSQIRSTHRSTSDQFEPLVPGSPNEFVFNALCP
jgi:hypothetical protein